MKYRDRESALRAARGMLDMGTFYVVQDGGPGEYLVLDELDALDLNPPADRIVFPLDGAKRLNAARKRGGQGPIVTAAEAGAGASGAALTGGGLFLLIHQILFWSRTGLWPRLSVAGLIHGAGVPIESVPWLDSVLSLVPYPPLLLAAGLWLLRGRWRPLIRWLATRF